jgi:hypothetical protein
MGPETRNDIVGKGPGAGPEAAFDVPTQQAAPKMHHRGDAGSHEMPGAGELFC